MKQKSTSKIKIHFKTKTQNKTTPTKTTNSKLNCAKLFQYPKILYQGDHHQTTSLDGKPPPQITNQKTSAKPPKNKRQILKNKPKPTFTSLRLLPEPNQ
ncbi:MAG: hypothetical protein ACPLZC_01100 [Candidatus Bathyarchaeales archaeon]